MIKFISLSLISLVVALIISCTKVKIDMNSWREGTKTTYLVTNREYLYKNNTYIPQKNAWYESVLTVIKKGKCNEVLWQQHIPISKRKNISDFDSIKGDTLNFIDGLKVRFSLTNDGVVKDIKNWDEIEIYLNSIVDSSIKNEKLKDPDFDDKKFKNFLNPFIKNHKAIEAKSLREFEIFHSIYGIELPIRNTVTYLDIDFNGIKAKRKIEYFRTKDINYYYLQITNKIDSFQIDSTNELISGIMEKTLQNIDFSKFNINITDTLKVLYKKDICLPEVIRFWRWSTLDSIRQITQYEMKMK